VGHLTVRVGRIAAWRGALLGCAVALVVATGAIGAEEEPWAYDLAADLMSPYCPGRTLASCPSPQAAELVQWMALQEAAGATREEVVAILVDRFGEEILGAPPAKGITLWAYVFPVLGFVVGGVLAFVVLRRIVAVRPASATGSPTGSPTGAPTGNEAGPRADARAAREASDDELARLVDADLAARG
jgi:cytochrome c-type biogenesis protein CcmH/NrfF